MIVLAEQLLARVAGLLLPFGARQQRLSALQVRDGASRITSCCPRLATAQVHHAVPRMVLEELPKLLLAPSAILAERLFCAVRLEHDVATKLADEPAIRASGRSCITGWMKLAHQTRTASRGGAYCAPPSNGYLRTRSVSGCSSTPSPGPVGTDT